MNVSSPTRDSALAELISFSLRSQAYKPAKGRGVLLAEEWIENPPILHHTHATLLDSYASPIEPLRERDKTALAALFEREDVDDIVIDVLSYLVCLWPEPCWDDDPFDFLEDYLA